MVDGELAPAPYTAKLGRSAEERAATSRRLEAAGVRALPYPFASAMSVVSDCDGSSRMRYEAYVAAFTDRGLDFGDSTWLHWNHQTAFRAGGGLGFFSYTYSKGLYHDAAWLDRTRTFAQSVAAFHAGDIDNFHALCRDGPRVVIVDCPQPDGECVSDGEPLEVFIGPFQMGGAWRADDLHLFGLLIEGDCDGAVVVEQDGAETLFDRRLSAPAPGQTLLAGPFDTEGENRALAMPRIGAIRLAGARGVRRIILLSCHSELLVERVAYLRGLNIEISLITEHSRLHFRHPLEAHKDDQAASERLKDPAGPLPALYGVISDDAGLVVSTDADDTRSPCRVLPDLFDLGLRFLAPAATEGFEGLDLLSVLSPTSTRAGGGGYWARRTMPLGRGPNPRTHQETFTVRMRAALDEAERRPGQAWPIYTHLGAMDLDAGRAGPPFVPSPYFDEADMAVLQDQALGISGREPRMWFARASVLYDYCLILGAVADHVQRDGDAIDIRSWRDPVLGRTLPCSLAQLFGLTFHVDDAATASVRLDGRAIETLARNLADETGRQSVTILECEIRSIVFDQLDPLANHPGEADIVGDCVWRNGELAVNGTVVLPMHGWSAPGAQALEFDAHGPFGIRLRTMDGSSFYFGDPRWNDESDDASYAFLKRGGGRFVVPFHDLAWRAATRALVPAPPFPSHPLASIAFMGETTFARLAFLRPRATMLRRDSFCVAGRVADFERGQIVRFGERREAVDQRGWFCFPRTPKGIYRLTTNGQCDRRGPLVEVGSDVVNLLLNRAL